MDRVSYRKVRRTLGLFKQELSLKISPSVNEIRSPPFFAAKKPKNPGSNCIPRLNSSSKPLTKNHFKRELLQLERRRKASASNLLLKPRFFRTSEQYRGYTEVKHSTKQLLAQFANPRFQAASIKLNRQRFRHCSFSPESLRTRLTKLSEQYLETHQYDIASTDKIDFLYGLVATTDESTHLRKKVEVIAAFMAQHDAELKVEETLFGLLGNYPEELRQKLLVSRFDGFLDALQSAY